MNASNVSPTFEHLSPAKRERVREAALEEFAERGYHGASVNRIVASVGMAKGSLFKYFGSKDGLLAHLFDHAVERFAQRWRDARGQDPDLPLWDALERAMETGLDFIEAHPRIHRLYLKMLFQEDCPLRGALLSQVRQGSARLLKPLLGRARERGEIRPDADLDAALFLVESALERFLQARSVAGVESGGLHEAEREEAMDFGRRLIALLRQGLEPQGASHV